MNQLSNPQSKILYILTGIGIFAGFILTLLSWTGACNEACTEGHSYRIFGLHFEWIGFVYFCFLIVTFALSKGSPLFSLLTSLLLAGGIGAEVMFILIQKYTIGVWCPICLGIAASVCFAALAWSADTLLGFKTMISQGKRSSIMQNLMRSLTTFTAFFLGFLIAFLGVAKHDDLLAAEKTFEERIVFGNEKSPIEVYIFTSWVCPACRRFEPILERMIPAIENKAKVIFVDYGVDDTTLNYLPYNLAFMFYDKEHYLKARLMLKEMAYNIDEPSDEEIEKASANAGLKYKQINYSDVAAGIEYFKKLSTDLKIKSLPAVVIIDNSQKKVAQLTGNQITESAVLKIIDDMREKKK